MQIIGHGRILKYNKEYGQGNNDFAVISFNLEEEMIPMAKLIAYCIERQRIVYKESLNFKVLDICSEEVCAVNFLMKI